MEKVYQVFDKSFKRILQEASPGTVVSFINGLFDTDFMPDSEVIFLNNESVREDLGGICSDMLMSVNRAHLFHIEAEIDPELNMALRMFDYGYAAALKRRKVGTDGVITLDFPKARALYWETTKKTPDTLTLRLIFPDDSVHNFRVETFKVLEHDLKDMERLRLDLLLPFQILKFRNRIKSADSRQAVAPELTAELKRLVGMAVELREKGILTANDELVIIGQIEILYNQIYTPYGEFMEAKKVIDEMVMSSIDKAKLAFKAEGKAEGKAEVARNLIKDGFPMEAVSRSTGLSPADIERGTQTVSSAFTGR
jgi:predicted transposase/invertase (TIGR01784 family)